MGGSFLSFVNKAAFEMHPNEINFVVFESAIFKHLNFVLKFENKEENEFQLWTGAQHFKTENQILMAIRRCQTKSL